MKLTVGNWIFSDRCLGRLANPGAPLSKTEINSPPTHTHITYSPQPLREASHRHQIRSLVQFAVEKSFIS